MKLKNLKIGSLRLPPEVETAIILIREDLKNTKLMSGLHALGFEDCHYGADLGTLVLAFAGFDERTDELFDAYYKILESHARKLEQNTPVPIKAALDVYMELRAKRKDIES